MTLPELPVKLVLPVYVAVNGCEPCLKLLFIVDWRAAAVQDADVELAGISVPITDVLPSRHRNLGQRLQQIEDWDDRFDALEAALCDCVGDSYTHTDHVSWAVRRIEQCRGELDMRSLARDLGYSQKHVATMFRDHVGVTPKRFARIVRFHHLVTHLRRGDGGTWAELAARFGYYDQPHLVSEVRQFTGITPTELRPLTANVLSGLS